MSGGEAQGCFFYFYWLWLLPARSRQTQARRNGLDGSVKGKEDAPELWFSYKEASSAKKRESPKAAVVFVKEVNEPASRLFVQYDMDYDMFFQIMSIRNNLNMGHKTLFLSIK